MDRCSWMMIFKTSSSILPQLFDTLAFFQQIVLLLFSVTKPMSLHGAGAAPNCLRAGANQMVTSPSGYNALHACSELIFCFSWNSSGKLGPFGLHCCLAGFDIFDLEPLILRVFRRKAHAQQKMRNLFFRDVELSDTRS